MHAAVEMLLLAGREDQMNASLCAEALGKLSKVIRVSRVLSIADLT
jgi:hypothetical protein